MSGFQEKPTNSEKFLYNNAEQFVYNNKITMSPNFAGGKQSENIA